MKNDGDRTSDLKKGYIYGNRERIVYYFGHYVLAVHKSGQKLVKRKFLLASGDSLGNLTFPYVLGNNFQL